MDFARRSLLARYGLALLTVVAFVICRNLPAVGPGMKSFAFVSVFLSAWFCGFGPGLMTTGLITLLQLRTISLNTNVVWAETAERGVHLVLNIVGGIGLCLLVRSRERAYSKVQELARLALGQSERSRTILQSIGDAVIVTDARGKIVSLNPMAEKLTGWTQAEAAGRELAEVFRIVHEDTWEVVENPVDKVFRIGAVVGLANHTVLLSRDGSETPIDDSAAPIRAGNGPIDGVVLVFRDVSDRRAQERRLSQAQMRFQAFMDNSPVVAFMKDTEGRYIWANAAWGRLHEGGLETALGKTDDDLWAPETAAQFRALDTQALVSFAPIEIEEPSVTRDGSTAHWISMKFRINDGEGRPVVGGISVDVTQRIQARNALRESEARYRMLFEANPHPMWVFDVESLNFLAVNDAAVARYGYSRDEFLGMKITDIRPAEDLPRLMERLKTYELHSYLSDRIWRHRKRDGTLIDVEVASHAIPFEGRRARLALAHDVTLRLVTERSLQISRERLDLVLDAGELGVWYCDLPTRKLTLNDRARAQLGFGPADEVTIDTYFLHYHPEDVAPIRAAIERAIADGSTFEAEYRVCQPNEPDRWLRSRGRAFYDDAGQPLRFDGINIDITAQKRSETQLVEAKEAAVEANQAKDKFLAVLGHELRTPLTPVLASVSAMLDDPASSGPDGPDWPAEVVRDTLSMIRRNVELETRLISDLLDVSRVERGQLRLQLERIDMHDAIRQGLEICRDEVLVSGLDIRLELDANEHEVDADHARLLQIVWNLIHNAAKFSAADSRLTIRSYNVTRDQSGTLLVVEFHDTGVGIEPETLPKIFDAFEQGTTEARRRLGGLGLGLAISRSIAEAHGGSLTAASPGRGQGSTFRLELEAVVTSLQSEVSEPDPVVATKWTPRSILLIEDNPDTLLFLMTLLRHRGYQVTTATRVDQALELAKEGNFDIVISDIELPDGSGLDIMRSLRGKVVGVAVSGFGSDSDIELSLDAGFSSHITKPLDFARLEAAIRGALAVSSG
jgi:PAS domain S-box-containing protein